MNLHLIGFPHTTLGDDRYLTCAYTQKVAKFQRMGWGDRLTVYHAESGDQAVSCLSAGRRERMFGEPDPVVPPEWPTDEQWDRFNRRAASELAERAQPGDLLLLAGGYSQRSIAERVPWVTPIEPGVGYEGVWASFAAYESYAWQHHVYARNGWDGRFFDAVIPNYFDPDEFPHVNQGGGDYLLFVGRVVERKGPQIAADIAARLGMTLKVAGPGPTDWGPGNIVAPEITVVGPVEYEGVLDTAARAELMAGAAAVIVPTRYVEPFGGVAVEAMMCGTPVVTTDWGAFAETVEAGVTGYRFRLLRDGVRAVEKAMLLDHETIRQAAHDRYSLAAVKPLFEGWFDALDTLRTDGWYASSDMVNDRTTA